MKLFRLKIEVMVEYEIRDCWYEFYLTQEDMNMSKEEIKKRYKRQDGSYIPNVNNIYFDERFIDWEEAKEDMTVLQFEQLFNKEVTCDE